MQEKSRFMVSWVPYRNRVAGVWFRQEKPLRFRAGPAGAAQAFVGCGDMSPLSQYQPCVLASLQCYVTGSCISDNKSLPWVSHVLFTNG